MAARKALAKGAKKGLKIAISEQALTSFELYTCLLEVANLMNQRPIGRIPNDSDDGSYLSQRHAPWASHLCHILRARYTRTQVNCHIF